MKRVLKTLLPICLVSIVATIALYYWNDYLTEKRITEANRIFSVNTDYGDSTPEEEEEWVDWQEEEQQYYPEIRPLKLDFLWDDPQDDQDSIRAALTYARTIYFTAMGSLLSDIMNEGKYEPEAKGKRAYFALAKYIYDFRAKADLPSITEAYIHLLPAYIPPSKYEEKGIGEVVRQLLCAYNATIERSNEFGGDEGFSLIYYHMLRNDEIEDEEENGDERDERYYRSIAEITNSEDYLDEFEELYRYGKEGDDDYEEYIEVDHRRLIWAYSFWARRYAEGIHQDVYYILKRIQQTYHEELPENNEPEEDYDESEEDKEEDD